MTVLADLTPVGLVKGPGEEPHQFTLISRDPDRRLRVGEFILYEVNALGAQRAVLARVVERTLVRRYPDAFLADPGVRPEAVAHLVGYDGPGSQLFEVTAETIGYFDRGFVNPRISPPAGSPVAVAPDAMLAGALNRRQLGERGAAEIGWLLSREPGRVPVVVDVGVLVATHMAILASTGAGKSYLAGVLIEEMLKANNRAAVIVIDPHGEYGTLDQLGTHLGVVTESYTPVVQVRQPGEVKMRYGALTTADVCHLLPDLSERMRYVLERAVRGAQRRSWEERGAGDWWTFNQLLGILEGMARDAHGEDGDRRDADTARALRWRLEQALGGTRLFDDAIQHGLREIVRPGCCTVLQLNEVGDREQQVMVAALLRRLYDARRATVRQEAAGREDGALFLPYPVFVLIEEAHRFAPSEGREVASTAALKTILAEGRKFGLGVGLISQRPGKLNADVLSQCRTQFLMTIINPLDQQRVAESIESAGRDILRELPALTKGQVVIAGPAVNTPVLAQVRERLTPHGAHDPFAPDEWAVYFSGAEAARRERAAAPVEMRPRGGDDLLWG